MVTTIFVANEDDVLISHYMKDTTLTILMWGKQDKEESFIEWKNRQSEEKLKKMLEQGFHPAILDVISGGRLSIKKLIDG